MRKGKKLGPRFDVTILDTLTQDDTSCIEKLRTQHHLALHPFHLNKVRDSIKDILDKSISKYNKELEGILCGYNNINILTYLAKIFDDSCFIHLDIEADFYIFKPTVGKILTGIVNKISKDHVGCLVHKTFNVAIPRPAKDKHWLGDKVTLGSEIILEVEHTDFDGLLPYIRGKLTSVLTQPEDAGELEQSSKKRTKKKKLSVSFSDNNNSSYQEEPPKKKRKKKEKYNETFGEDTEIVEETETPKKRKKSKSLCETENNGIDIEESPKKHRNRSLSECDTSELLSDKKIKKIKSERNKTVDDSINFEDDTSEIVSKKKHKKVKSEINQLDNYITDPENEASEIVSKKKLKKIKSEMINFENNSEDDTVEITSKKKHKKLKSEISFEDHPVKENDEFDEFSIDIKEQSPSKKKKIKRDLSADEEEVPKKKKIKRELDIFE